MTAPVAMSGFADVTTRIAAIQATIASISAPAPSRAAAPSTAPSTAAFSAALSDAGATSGTAATAATATSAGSGSVTGSAVVAAAEKYVGVPYVWGGESMQGIDCSGLTQATYRSLGIDIPRVAADQQNVGTAVPSLAQAQPGDLLFFGDPAYHVAIYAGDNKLIESPEPGKTVHVTDVYQTPTSIRRLVSAAAPSFAAAAPTGGGLTAVQLTAAGLSPAVAAYAGQFAAAESRFHLPAGLLAAVAQQESGGNARAVSPAGAQGLMQLMPSTAAGMGVNAFDPAQAITAAAQILSTGLKSYDGSVQLALAAYNAGGGAVARYGGIPPYTETQNYVRSITAMLDRMPGRQA